MDDAFTSRLEITYGPAELVDPVGSADPVGAVGFAGGLGAEPGPPISPDLHPILRDFAHSADSASHQAWLTGLTWTARTAHALLHDGEALWADDRTAWSCLISSYP